MFVCFVQLGEHCKELKDVHFGQCYSISDEGLVALAQGCSKLQRIYMQENKLVRAETLWTLRRVRHQALVCHWGWLVALCGLFSFSGAAFLNGMNLNIYFNIVYNTLLICCEQRSCDYSESVGFLWTVVVLCHARLIICWTSVSWFGDIVLELLRNASDWWMVNHT